MNTKYLQMINENSTIYKIGVKQRKQFGVERNSRGNYEKRENSNFIQKKKVASGWSSCLFLCRPFRETKKLKYRFFLLSFSTNTSSHWSF